MRPFLLYEHYDNDKNRKKLANENELIQDLNMNIIFEAMACNNDIIYNAAKSVILTSLSDTNTIIYRQKILEDCLRNNAIMHIFFDISSKALKEADLYKEYTRPHFAKIIPVSARVVKAVGLLEILIIKLEELKTISIEAEKDFKSNGLNSFCKMLNDNLTDEFFKKVKVHISELKVVSQGGKMVIGAALGNGIKGTSYVLRKLPVDSQNKISKKRPQKTLENNQIPLGNSSLAKSALEILDAGLIHILRVVNHFANDTISFFESLRYEAGFYVGCTNLYNELSKIKVSMCFPIPTDISKNKLEFAGLYDASMAIKEKKKLVENNISADDKSLFIITGANQGGKSTFLRSIGLAQILMQCGLFVPASYYCANVCDHIFTHFTREEDAGMNSGKLEEELIRMNSIINNITPASLLLFNEPFATTTERDGSRIASEITTALYESSIKVLFVTHLYEFANSIYDRNLDKAVFLRAERHDNGDRSFYIKVGEPLRTSYGEDLYNNMIMNQKEYSDYGPESI